ncbi:MAG: hypothetical protein FP814_02495 [Desulfobacterium sp.]|nr:hypothetical protein [Desulfobacteraceae bacterium]MBA3035342.1 hypothetical protein [Desulfobacterium sp.]MBU3948949.1 hypothetical protein [Pseudomonadota bacterium]
MTFETAKIIAAFGGFGLGILNLGISIYKEFIKRPKLELEIVMSNVFYVNEGEYNFQINISLISKNGPCYLKDIFIKHPTNCIGGYSSSNIVNFNKAIQYTSADLLDNSQEEFKDNLLKLFKNSISMRDLKIDDNSRKSMTFADRLITRREMDGYEDFPLKNWIIVIDYGDKTITKSLTWNIHSKSKKEGCWDNHL